MKQLKITIIVPDYPPDEIGGTEMITKDLATQLGKNHKVTVITTGNKRFEKKGNLTIIKTKKMFKNKILYNIQEVLFFIRTALRLDSDIIIGHMVTSAGLSAVILGILKGKPVVLRLSGAELRFPKIVQQTILRSILNRSDGIITINSKMKEIVERLTKSKVIVLPHGTSLQRQVTRASKPNKNVKIIMISRLVKFKNIDMILEVAKKLKDYEFTIIGDGSEKNRLKKIAQPNVKLLGFLKHKETMEKVKKSDVLVLTSIREPFGRVILEAMSYGLPVVATNVGGPKDIIKNNYNGYLVEVDNVNDFADKVKLAVKNKVRLGSNNLKEIYKYSWEEILPKYERFYQRML